MSATTTTFDSMDTTTVTMRSVREYTEEEQKSFIEGWDSVGGYSDDLDGTAPWCTPWEHGSDVSFPATLTPYEAGQAWWAEVEADVEDEVDEESNA